MLSNLNDTTNRWHLFKMVEEITNWVTDNKNDLKSV